MVEQKTAGSMDDIYVMNNTIVDLKAPGSRTLTMITDVGGTYTNSGLVNNCLVNGNPPEIDASSPTPVDNVNVTQANGATYFVSYSYLGGTSNNMQLTAAATTALRTGGTSVSAQGVTTDITGAAYANPPSVGAYQYLGQIAQVVYKRIGKYLRLHGLAF